MTNVTIDAPVSDMELVAGLRNSQRLNGSADLRIDSRQIEPGDVFLAFPGQRTDGRRYIDQAIKRGASAIVWEPEGFDFPLQWQSLTNSPVPGLAGRLGGIADAFYCSPSRRLSLIGVTGTNGKTSVSTWIAQALTLAGQRTGIIGTLGCGYIGELKESGNTTPDAVTAHRQLARFVAEGAGACAMEVSSIGLEEKRCAGLYFDTAVFTNLTRDHLDYHGTMDAYGAAKKSLFQWDGLNLGILNVDDPFGRQIAEELVATGLSICRYSAVGEDLNVEVRATNLIVRPDGLSFRLQTPDGGVHVETGLVGRFNAENLLAVASVLWHRGVSPARIAEIFWSLQPPCGRMQRLGGRAGIPLVVIDYAHTPDSLVQALVALGEQARVRHGKLKVVFGCGGDRDPGKRPLMGEAAARWSDEVWITSDNPRSESPAEIARAVQEGAPDARIEIERERAIAEVIRQADPRDVILVAGKGHEDYQEVQGVRIPFSDARVAADVLKECWGWG